MFVYGTKKFIVEGGYPDGFQFGILVIRDVVGDDNIDRRQGTLKMFDGNLNETDLDPKLYSSPNIIIERARKICEEEKAVLWKY